MVSIADRVRARVASVIAIPAYRPTARIWRSFVAAKSALVRPAQSPSIEAGAWLPEAVAHLEPVDSLIGTPGPFQTVVVRLVDPSSGSLSAIAKVLVSCGSDATTRVRTEAAALLAMAETGVAPVYLADGEVDGHPFLVMRFVSGRPLGASHSDFLRASGVLDYQTTDARRIRAGEHPWLEIVREKLPDVGLGAMPDHLGVVRTHGDFAPWNVLASERGRYIAIDWEASAATGVQYSDLAHYVLAVERFLRRRLPSVAAARAVRVMQASLGLAIVEARAIVVLAAAAAVLRDAPEPNTTNVDRYWLEVINSTFGGGSRS